MAVMVKLCKVVQLSAVTVVQNEQKIQHTHETSRKVKIMRPAVTAVTVAAVRAKQMQLQARPLRPFRLWVSDFDSVEKGSKGSKTTGYKVARPKHPKGGLLNCKHRNLFYQQISQGFSDVDVLYARPFRIAGLVLQGGAQHLQLIVSLLGKALDIVRPGFHQGFHHVSPRVTMFHHPTFRTWSSYRLHITFILQFHHFSPLFTTFHLRYVEICQVPRGALIGVVGATGAGKSSLLQAILGAARRELFSSKVLTHYDWCCEMCINHHKPISIYNMLHN